MILIIALVLAAWRIFCSGAEIAFERDWPRRTWRGLLISLGLLWICGSAFGQFARVDVPIQTSGPNVPSGAGPLPQALWVSNASASVCIHSASDTSLAWCQANPMQTVTDANGSANCPSATPLVQLPGNTCTAYTGVTSNLGLWYGGGIFDYWLVSSYGTFGPYTINPANSGGGSGTPQSQCNVIQQGAKGDCTTDDHAAIQACLNTQLASTPQITVYFPAPAGRLLPDLDAEHDRRIDAGAGGRGVCGQHRRGCNHSR